MSSQSDRAVMARGKGDGTMIDDQAGRESGSRGGLGGPSGRARPADAGVLVFVAVLAAGVGCWVVCSDARTDRVSRVLLAWRGNAGCLPSGLAPVTAPRRGCGPGRAARD
jgi:hypothetical protein